MKKSLIIAVALVLFMVGIAFAPTGSVPKLINYQGMLTESDGTTPVNGLRDLTFKIYDVPSGGSALWTVIYNDQDIQNGLVNVLLSYPSSVFNGPDRWLGITVWPDPELSPRIRLTSVGYAYRAEVADSAIWAAGAAGVGTLVGQLNINIPTTATALISKTISVPGAGKVIAMCTGSVYLGGLGAGNNYMIRLKLNLGASTSTTEDGYVIFIRDSNTNSGIRMVPFALSRDFTISGAGSLTVNLTGWLQFVPAQYTTIGLDDRVLTLLYVPNTY